MCHNLVREETKTGEKQGHGKFLDVFIKDPEATAEQMAGTMLCSTSPRTASLSLSFTHLWSLSLLIALFFSYPATFSSRQCRPPSQLQTKEDSNQLASEPVSQAVGQCALQRALPITIWFFSWGSEPVFPLHKCHDVPAGLKLIHMSECPYHNHLFL